MSENGTP